MAAVSPNDCGAVLAGLVRSIMRKNKSAIGGLGLASSAHIFRALRPAVRLILIGSLILLTAGCATISPRNVLPQASASQIEVEGFHNIRFWGDASGKEIQSIMMADAPQTDTRRSLGPVRHPPLSNLLAISGGAEDGAFGAGLLVGWSDAGTRPPFDLVTGVSSGALIAPFAFLGREHDRQLREIFTKYGRKDVFTYNVHGLLEGSSLTDDAPLAKLIETYVDDAFIQQVARERIKGRMLLIGTTNLDTQRPVLWDMGRIAMSNNRDAAVLFRKILLASATLPGVFPPVRIQVRVGGKNYDELHVDGGVTRQVFIAPSVLSFASHDQKAARPAPKPRLYVIRNGKFDPKWQSVGENVLSITSHQIGARRSNRRNNERCKTGANQFSSRSVHRIQTPSQALMLLKKAPESPPARVKNLERIIQSGSNRYPFDLRRLRNARDGPRRLHARDGWFQHAGRPQSWRRRD